MLSEKANRNTMNTCWVPLRHSLYWSPNHWSAMHSGAQSNYPGRFWKEQEWKNSGRSMQHRLCCVAHMLMGGRRKSWGLYETQQPVTFVLWMRTDNGHTHTRLHKHTQIHLGGKSRCVQSAVHVHQYCKPFVYCGNRLTDPSYLVLTTVLHHCHVRATTVLYYTPSATSNSFPFIVA